MYGNLWLLHIFDDLKKQYSLAHYCNNPLKVMAQLCHSPIILASFNWLLWFYGSDLYYFYSLLLLLAVSRRRKLYVCCLPDTSINTFMMPTCNGAFVAQEQTQNRNLNYLMLLNLLNKRNRLQLFAKHVTQSESKNKSKATYLMLRNVVVYEN